MKAGWRVPAGRFALIVSAALTGTCLVASVQADSPTDVALAESRAAMIEPILDKYCSRCHNDFDNVAGLSIADLRASDIANGRNTEAWEKILRRVASGEMPPHSKPQPDMVQRAAMVEWLDAGRAQYVSAHPDPGKSAVRRLNRIEYANAVRDLLGVEADVARDLPPDNSGFGFDNIADVLSVSPTLMERYVAVAGKVARQATGLVPSRAFVTTWQVPKDGSVMNSGVPAFNERAGGDLPLASRGGTVVRYFARYDGTYDVVAWLNSNTNNETDRLTEDRYTLRLPLTAGTHRISVSFRRQTWPDESVQWLRNDTDYVPLPLDKPKLLPMDVWVDGKRAGTVQVPSWRMHPRYSQRNFPRDVLQVDVAGPYDAKGITETPSQRAIFTCRPRRAAEEAPCAQEIIASLARRAWRRPVSTAEVAPLMRLYGAERTNATFEQSIEVAIEAILVSPQFLFVVESPPPAGIMGTAYPVSDLDLATRLALFLWSSIPDERLLALAEQGQLRASGVLDAEIARMLADPRAQALTENFAGQWLYLRNLDQQRPDITEFPDFDTRLRTAMATETKMFFAYVMGANRPVTDFIRADYTFLNQRLARHYGIGGVSGTAFRKVALDPATARGGLLGQASILTVTSYGNHTSVVKRGKWILDNMLASPPPPPPPDVPALKAEHDGRKLTARQQLELHRANPNCAACHVKMDPLGFALENFDAVGAWRTVDAGQSIDNTATMPDGSTITGFTGLQHVLLDRRDEFAQAFTERLMTYALARGVGPQDMPAIRAIARKAAQEDYRVQTIVRGIVTSPAFTMRKTAALQVAEARR
ncbi:MAG: DUF1592 domain-containing protein [Novosphingobium sp.]|uniref:DUF1592 domain-containing protein n=1 Tax=Novosphingobium sp. TaxID=1874826 RepID=UPI002734E9FC|nr:DUF1592 domain-containing protein [Novosphingobium sp.]MDP3550513.1 DUF1592 domain-containing protein [Novosphingobium sp.]